MSKRGIAHYRQRVDAAFLKGWDAALIGPIPVSNPYHRDDFKRRWERGYTKCLRGDALPDWVRYPWRYREVSHV